MRSSFPVEFLFPRSSFSRRIPFPRVPPVPRSPPSPVPAELSLSPRGSHLFHGAPPFPWSPPYFRGIPCSRGVVPVPAESPVFPWGPVPVDSYLFPWCPPCSREPCCWLHAQSSKEKAFCMVPPSQTQSLFSRCLIPVPTVLSQPILSYHSRSLGLPSLLVPRDLGTPIQSNPKSSLHDNRSLEGTKPPFFFLLFLRGGFSV